jgi:hypothetical protein
MRKAATLATAGAAMAVASACQPVTQPDPAPAPLPLRHEGVETIPIDEDIVTIIVWMSGPATGEDLIAYSRCAAAGYAVNRGYGFARHVRTNVDVEGSTRSADAVYTVSPTLPRGLQTIDAEVTVADCAELGIPTV